MIIVSKEDYSLLANVNNYQGISLFLTHAKKEQKLS